MKQLQQIYILLYSLRNSFLGQCLQDIKRFKYNKPIFLNLTCFNMLVTDAPVQQKKYSPNEIFLTDEIIQFLSRR